MSYNVQLTNQQIKDSLDFNFASGTTAELEDGYIAYQKPTVGASAPYGRKLTFTAFIDFLKTKLKIDPVAKTSGMTQAVGADSDGKLWTTPGSGGGTWGSITGTLADQEDLQDALDGKIDASEYDPDTKTEEDTQPVRKDANGKLWTTPSSGVQREITVSNYQWQPLSGKAPFNFSASVSLAIMDVTDISFAELINNDPVSFANHGFALASFTRFQAVFYAISKPSGAVTLTVNYR